MCRARVPEAAGLTRVSLRGYGAPRRRVAAEQGAGALPPSLAIVTDMGRASREQGNCIVREAVTAMMGFWEAPFRCAATHTNSFAPAAGPRGLRCGIPGESGGGCARDAAVPLRLWPSPRRPVQDSVFAAVLEASGPAVAEWLGSTAYAAQMASLFPLAESGKVRPRGTPRTRCCQRGPWVPARPSAQFWPGPRRPGLLAHRRPAPPPLSSPASISPPRPRRPPALKEAPDAPVPAAAVTPALLLPAHSPAPTQMGAEALALREAQVTAECGEAFAAVAHFEGTHGLVLSSIGPAYVAQRPVLISRLLDLSSKLGLRDEVVHDAVLLLDRTASQVRRGSGGSGCWGCLGAVPVGTLLSLAHTKACAGALPPMRARFDAYLTHNPEVLWAVEGRPPARLPALPGCAVEAAPRSPASPPTAYPAISIYHTIISHHIHITIPISHRLTPHRVSGPQVKPLAEDVLPLMGVAALSLVARSGDDEGLPSPAEVEDASGAKERKKERKTYARCQACVKGALASKSHRASGAAGPGARGGAGRGHAGAGRARGILVWPCVA